MEFKFVLVGAFALLTACIPIKYAETPKICGRVVENESKQPISGATIYFKKYPDKKIQSDLQGKFLFEPITKWILVPLGPFDFMPPHGYLLIEMTGYEKYEKKLFGPAAIESDFELTREKSRELPSKVE